MTRPVEGWNGIPARAGGEATVVDRQSVRRWGSSWPRILLAAGLGAVFFVAAQVSSGATVHIADAIGGQIVRQGGYPDSGAAAIGWFVHVSVSLAYAALYGFLVSCSFLHGSKLGPRLTGLMLVPILGYLSTAITAPAVALTVSLLAGQGLPATLPAFSPRLDFAFGNHAAFFMVCWVVYFAPVARTRMREEEARVVSSTGAQAA
jgi:hypothetical protein